MLRWVDGSSGRAQVNLFALSGLLQQGEHGTSGSACIDHQYYSIRFTINMIHICMYIYIYIFMVHTYICVYIYIHTCKFIHVYIIQTHDLIDFAWDHPRVSGWMGILFQLPVT